MKSIDTSTKKTSGFSLVEIALALGVVGFSLAALLGLLATASDVSADSGRETAMVSMSSQVMSDLRIYPFDALWKADPRRGNSTPVADSEPEPSAYYFNAEGARLGMTDYDVEGNNAENNPEAVYRCTVVKTIDRASVTPKVGEQPERANMLRLQLLFEWPVTAPASKRQNHTVHATIARY